MFGVWKKGVLFPSALFLLQKLAEFLNLLFSLCSAFLFLVSFFPVDMLDTLPTTVLC